MLHFNTSYKKIVQINLLVLCIPIFSIPSGGVVDAGAQQCFVCPAGFWCEGSGMHSCDDSMDSLVGSTNISHCLPRRSANTGGANTGGSPVVTEAINKATLVGIIVGVLDAVAIIAILCYYCYRQTRGDTSHTGLALQTCVYHVGDAVPSASHIYYNAFACEEPRVYANIPRNYECLHQRPDYANTQPNYGGVHHVPGVVPQTQIPVYCNYQEIPSSYHPYRRK
jgi:hypothetical protein